MSKPKSTRLRATSRLILVDGTVVPEGAVANVPTAEAEAILRCGGGVEAKDEEPTPDAPDTALPPAAAVTYPALPAAPTVP